MSEEDKSSKTEEPTEKKLRDARKKGDVPQSRETGTAMLVFALLMILIFVLPASIDAAPPSPLPLAPTAMDTLPAVPPEDAPDDSDREPEDPVDDDPDVTWIDPESATAFPELI